VPYRFLEHTADAGLSATGASLAEVFASAADGLAALLCEPETVNPCSSIDVEASAGDVESLLVQWLSEVNYRFEVDRFAFRSFDVHDVSETHVKGIGRGERIDPERHRIGAQVKAITYHQLEVKRDGDRWSARVIVDI
jgi:SHS2 domain-containing protein